jgi:hypothetical protein
MRVMRITTAIVSIMPLQIRPFDSYEFEINWEEIFVNVYIEINAGPGRIEKCGLQ